MIIKLSHPSDPRFLLVAELPERVTLDDLACWRYGKVLLFAPGPVDAVYSQPDGFGTDWVRPVDERPDRILGTLARLRDETRQAERAFEDAIERRDRLAVWLVERGFPVKTVAAAAGLAPSYVEFLFRNTRPHTARQI